MRVRKPRLGIYLDRHGDKESVAPLGHVACVVVENYSRCYQRSRAVSREVLLVQGPVKFEGLQRFSRAVEAHVLSEVICPC